MDSNYKIRIRESRLKLTRIIMIIKSLNLSMNMITEMMRRRKLKQKLKQRLLLLHNKRRKPKLLRRPKD